MDQFSLVDQEKLIESFNLFEKSFAHREKFALHAPTPPTTTIRRKFATLLFELKQHQVCN